MPQDERSIAGNQPAHWHKVDGNAEEYFAPAYARYGRVWPHRNGTHWYWEAFLMIDCMLNGQHSLYGKAIGLAGAKHIVEVLCQETGTANPASGRS